MERKNQKQDHAAGRTDVGWYHVIEFGKRSFERFYIQQSLKNFILTAKQDNQSKVA